MAAPSDRLAATPPMGWNSWNGFMGGIHEQFVREVADAMVSSGLQQAGYEYVVIDDLWHGGRDTQGRLFPDPAKFPSGMKALADYIHARGLKFGIYSDAGYKTCGGMPGSDGCEAQDADTFAAWEVDFLKYDYCYAPEDRATAMRRYAAMGEALRKTQRPILYSVCEWGMREPWLWAREVGGHMWRTTLDIIDCWDCSKVHSNAGNSVLTILDLQPGLEKYAGPHGWNDPDMLIVGLYGKCSLKGGGCTETEYRTHMSLWCLLAAPLMAACDVRKLNDTTREMLTNPEVLAVDQDPLGRQGARVSRDAMVEVWSKPLANGDLAVGLFNRGAEYVRITETWSVLGLQGPHGVRDLWARKDLGVSDGRIAADVAPHGIALLRLSRA